jgi:site-specific recombinase XerD
MVDGWCRQRETESGNSCRQRIYVVATFIKYLRSRELTAVEPPYLPPFIKTGYIPHAFSKEELHCFFEACDSIVGNRTQEQRMRRITLPVFFRLLYSSGIRTTEARLLRVQDVDLGAGVLDIKLTKGYNQHYVVLHDTMRSLMKKYDEAINRIFPGRVYFFPSRTNSCHTRQWVQINFQELWRSVNTSYATAYELRHNYAIENINQWVDCGMEFNTKFLYLSKCMGHSTFESTEYYYSLVPGLADIIQQNTNVSFEAIIPDIKNENNEKTE